jgi:AbrB family looped-hinge helix DNA binding protein
MPTSTVTARGQTTIPKEVRKSLGLKPNDKLLYVVSGDSVILRPIHGSLLGLRGIFKDAVKGKGPVDFKKLREETKRAIGKRIVEEMR